MIGEWIRIWRQNISWLGPSAWALESERLLCSIPNLTLVQAFAYIKLGTKIHLMV